MSWIDNSSLIPTWNMNGDTYPYRQFDNTIIKGLLDISGGNLILRNGGLFTQTDISSNGNIYGTNAYITGNVAISKPTAGFTLDVSGIINATALYVNGTSYIGSQWTTLSSNIYYDTGNVAIGKSTNPLYTLDVNGNTNSTAFYTTSDYRIKSNLTPITTRQFTIDNLYPLYYINTKLNREDLGFIAHEVQHYYPFMVSGVKDDTDTTTGIPIHQTVNYNAIIPILVAEVKELKAKINNQETHINNQQAQINKLCEIIYNTRGEENAI